MQAEWTKREVLSLSRAQSAGEEKRSSYWWLSRRWGLGFAELSSLLASCLELRGAIYFQQRLAGGLSQAPRPRASGGDPRAGPSSSDAPPAPAAARRPVTGRPRPRIGRQQASLARAALHGGGGGALRADCKRSVSHRVVAGVPPQKRVLRPSQDKHTSGPLPFEEW